MIDVKFFFLFVRAVRMKKLQFQKLLTFMPICVMVIGMKVDGGD